MQQTTSIVYLDDSTYDNLGIFSEFERQRATVKNNPPYNSDIHCAPYIKLAKQWRTDNSFTTPKGLVKSIRDAFFKNHRDTPKKYLLEIWETTEERFMQNPGFARYYMDHCLTSKWYPRWPLCVPTARAVVGSFGYGWDLEGRFGKYPITDPHGWWSDRHPALRYILQRGKNSAYFIKTQCDYLAQEGILNNRKQRILVLSAGYIPCLTMLSYQADPSIQKVVACDMDPNINLEEVQGALPMDALSAVSYKTCRNEEIIGSEEYRGYFDIILMDGGYIYYPPATREYLLDATLRLLNRRGILVFDNQVESEAMSFAMELFDWGINPQIFLEKNQEILLRNVEKFAHDRQLYPEVYPIGDVGASIKLVKT